MPGARGSSLWPPAGLRQSGRQRPLRLLEAPGASASLELDVRVWPRPLAAPVAEKEKVLLEQEAKDFRRESRHAFQAVKPLKGH